MIRRALSAPGRLLVRLRVLWDLYVWRVRQYPGQESMAAVGIAVGVALFFGVLAASSGITGSAPKLVHEIVGSARLTLGARSSEGFSEQTAEAAGNLRGVAVASPLLRTSAVVIGPKGRRSVQLIGVTASFISLEGEATRNLGAGGQLLAGGIGVPEQTASEIGVVAGHSTTLLVDGSAQRVPVRSVLGSQTIGAIASSPIAVGLLPTVQRLAGLPHRVTQVLIRPQAGADTMVARELHGLEGGRLAVTSADNELRLLDEAAKPSDESTRLFALVGVMVGFLLALNAVLLTTPERRRFVAEMRTLGFKRQYLLVILASQALILGVAGSIVGVALGDLLARTLFHQVPGYLAFAFLLNAQPSIHATTVVLAVGCGVLAAVGASLPCAVDLRSKVNDAVLREGGEAGQGMSTGMISRFSLAGVGLIVTVTGVVVVLPSVAVAAGVLLAAAAVCLIPLAYFGLVRALAWGSDNIPGSLLPITVAELRDTAIRSIALAGIVALAVYGSVAIGGAQHDLLAGLDEAIGQEWGKADIWVTPDSNIFSSDTFRAGKDLTAIAHAPGIASVETYQAGFLDVGAHRLWIRATPPSSPAMILSSQLLQGDLAHATSLMRGTGWATVSGGFSNERHLSLDSTFTLPTPSGTVRFRVAAITTNIGWPSGTINLNTNDYDHYWQSTTPTSIAVSLKAGVSTAAGKHAVERALGYPQGLRVQSTSERVTEVEGIVREGLKSLGEIATLLLITAALAVASALSAAIWQRRSYLAALKMTGGFKSRQIWRALLLESAALLFVGCVDGTVLGVYGHALASRWLKQTTGFPAPFSLAGTQILLTLIIVMGIALAVVFLPGRSAAKVSVRESFQE
jgi:putative ABC transport system permease protein